MFRQIQKYDSVFVCVVLKFIKEFYDLEFRVAVIWSQKTQLLRASLVIGGFIQRAI